MSEKEFPTFEELYVLNIQEHVEKKGKFSYLAWAYGWREMKRIDPEATEHIHEFPLVINGIAVEGVAVPYLWTPQGYFVKNTVIFNGKSATEYLPVLNNQNKPIENPTPFDINTSNKRCFVKALAKHGIGLHLYVGEDLPEDITPPVPATKAQIEMLSKILEAVSETTGTTLEVLKANLVQKTNISSILDKLTKDEYGAALNYANALKIAAEKKMKQADDAK